MWFIHLWVIKQKASSFSLFQMPEQTTTSCVSSCLVKTVTDHLYVCLLCLLMRGCRKTSPQLFPNVCVCVRAPSKLFVYISPALAHVWIFTQALWRTHSLLIDALVGASGQRWN